MGNLQEAVSSVARVTAGGKNGKCHGIPSHGGGGPTYFFGSKISTLGIFLGQEIRQVFFWWHTDFISSLTQNHAEEDYV